MWIRLGLSCWSIIPCGSPNNQLNIFQDFVASTHSDFFRGEMDRGLFYWPNHSGKLSSPNFSG